MTARDEILNALPRLRARLGREDFTPAEVIQELRSAGSGYSDSTIRTHVTSRMCSNAPDNHGSYTTTLSASGTASTVSGRPDRRGSSLDAGALETLGSDLVVRGLFADFGDVLRMYSAGPQMPTDTQVLSTLYLQARATLPSIVAGQGSG